jgi:hypothetical protein
MKRDWRREENRVQEPLIVGVWYRSPLWDHDHCLGRIKEFVREGDAWCGRPLQAAMDYDNSELGGLWFTNRTGSSAQCAECRRREKAALGVG